MTVFRRVVESHKKIDAAFLVVRILYVLQSHDWMFQITLSQKKSKDKPSLH